MPCQSSHLLSPHPPLPTRETITNKSKAAAGLCEWAINIVMYYDVVSEVEPKRQELAEANAKLEQANVTLSAVQAKVAQLNEQVRQLEEQFAAAVAEKEDAIRQSERCQLKLQLANRLITALASEGESPAPGCKVAACHRLVLHVQVCSNPCQSDAACCLLL